MNMVGHAGHKDMGQWHKHYSGLLFEHQAWKASKILKRLDLNMKTIVSVRIRSLLMVLNDLLP